MQGVEGGESKSYQDEVDRLSHPALRSRAEITTPADRHPCYGQQALAGIMTDTPERTTMTTQPKKKAKARKASPAPIVDPNTDLRPPEAKSDPVEASDDYKAVDGFLAFCRKFIADEDKYDWAINLCKTGAVHPDTNIKTDDVDEIIARSRA